MSGGCARCSGVSRLRVEAREASLLRVDGSQRTDRPRSSSSNLSAARENPGASSGARIAGDPTRGSWPLTRHQSGKVSEKRGGIEQIPVDSGPGRVTALGSGRWRVGDQRTAIREPLTARSRGCSIRTFGEGKLEIPA
jgi:hypothetical protein